MRLIATPQMSGCESKHGLEESSQVDRHRGEGPECGVGGMLSGIKLSVHEGARALLHQRLERWLSG